MNYRSVLFVSVFLFALFFSGKEKSAFRLILLPDTQTYASNFPEILKAQTSWIAENRKSIAFVLQQGDMTDNNTEPQWEVVASSFSLMDGKVPYTFAPGNHDIGTRGITDVRNTDLLNHYLPYEKYRRMRDFGGAFEPGKMDNTWHTFKAGGYKWLILSLEFAPRDSVLDWAGSVIKAHPAHKVILNTHAYLYSDDKRMSRGENHKWLPETYGIGKNGQKGAVNSGEEMWQKLVRKYPNIMFVFCGHVLNDGTGALVSTGDHGNKVYQMLANYQGGVEGTVKGGNGFLRMIDIDPDRKTISVKTYSPYTNEFRTEPDQQFSYSEVQF